MRRSAFILSISIVVLLQGCATRSSSRALAPTEGVWSGPVLVSQTTIPAGIEYKVIGSVSADARAGYDRVVTLYPLLAAEARKLGANAVINATGGRRLTAFSWSAAYVSGTAVRVQDPEKLKALSGTFH
ncbi:MAG: hypothetical protein JWP22_1735 [Ramlibacter sp.]|nr:hypothetical protein [Ramlibacter sp.]